MPPFTKKTAAKKPAGKKDADEKKVPPKFMKKGAKKGKC